MSDILMALILNLSNSNQNFHNLFIIRKSWLYVGIEQATPKPCCFWWYLQFVSLFLYQRSKKQNSYNYVEKFVDLQQCNLVALLMEANIRKLIHAKKMT